MDIAELRQTLKQRYGQHLENPNPIPKLANPIQQEVWRHHTCDCSDRSAESAAMDFLRAGVCQLVYDECNVPSG